MHVSKRHVQHHQGSLKYIIRFRRIPRLGDPCISDSTYIRHHVSAGESDADGLSH